ncbi:sodium:calcium antiporter [Candidatus Contubernalis alkaliaceticus]|uniref:sodium:calcium antiporter n=1 Tax=Candidatus Contubernalis alkaliaceticus TaxID=338645 RepID=UPI001F4C0ABD|nr:sodium:calcium antiporter [Candidatus Contubernalis alkalaceticus]UNC93687.1 sodium:calcium antiporter [Candidatus Contubernalis alkalaceticus]
MTIWIKFILSMVLIIFAGTRLTRSADLIAERTGLGMMWAGALLLPLATSLPEIATSARSSLIGAPDLALGNIFGSNIFNVVIIALIDLISPGYPVLRQVKVVHILTAGICIAMTSFITVNIMLPTTISIFGIGLESWMILVFYIFGSRLLLRYERRFPVLKDENVSCHHLEGKTLTQGIVVFLISSAIIIFAGIILVDSGKVIADQTGLGETLVGSIFIAISTSLPELVTTVAAARMGLLDMAIGNIFGSNFLNLFIVFIAEIFYSPGPVLKDVSVEHLLTAQISIFLMAVAIIGLIYRSKKQVASLGLDSIAIVITYLITVFLLFSMGITS